MTPRATPTGPVKVGKRLVNYETGMCDRPGCAGGHLPGRCGGHKTTMQACRKRPVDGASVCGTHGASAPQVRNAARLRLLGAADQMAAQMIALAMARDTPHTVRQRAAADVLDRAGLGARHVVEVSGAEAGEQVEAAVDELWRMMQQPGEAEGQPASGAVG